MNALLLLGLDFRNVCGGMLKMRMQNMCYPVSLVRRNTLAKFMNAFLFRADF